MITWLKELLFQFSRVIIMNKNRYWIARARKRTYSFSLFWTIIKIINQLSLITSIWVSHSLFYARGKNLLDFLIELSGGSQKEEDVRHRLQASGIQSDSRKKIESAFKGRHIYIFLLNLLMWGIERKIGQNIYSYDCSYGRVYRCAMNILVCNDYFPFLFLSYE